jgi:single stranded DNA-binding protein
MEKISLIGHLGADAVKKVVNEKQMVSFNVCANKKKTDKGTGEVVEIPTWYQCSMYLNSEKVISHLTKGNRVYVYGDISFEDYKDKGGIIKHGKNIWVNDLQLIDFNVEESSKDEN